MVSTGPYASACARPAHLWSGGHRPGCLGFHFYFGGKMSHMGASCFPPFLSPSGSQQGFFFVCPTWTWNRRGTAAHSWRGMEGAGPVQPGAAWQAVSKPAPGGQARWLCRLSRSCDSGLSLGSPDPHRFLPSVAWGVTGPV